MAAQVSYEQRLEVRTALREAGVNQETVDEIDDGDIDKLYNNNWKRKGLLLSAQRDDLLAAGVSRGAVGVIISLEKSTSRSPSLNAPTVSRLAPASLSALLTC